MAERDEEKSLDNEGNVVYNNTIHASKKVTKENTPYFIHKNFPAGEPWREAHRLAIWWSNNPNVATGDQTLISMNNRWYLVEKFDDADNGYQVEALISKKEFDKILKEIKENGRSGKIKSIQRSFVFVNKLDQSSNTVTGKEPSADSDITGHGEKDKQIQSMDRSEIGGRERPSRNGDGNSQSGGTDRQGDSLSYWEAPKKYEHIPRYGFTDISSKTRYIQKKRMYDR